MEIRVAGADHFAPVRSMPEMQQEFADAGGMMFLSQQRGADPCSPGCT
jgi:hypothetical protein